jgi:hypothetical protein
MGDTLLNGRPAEDWREQGWCCRECAVMAWYGMSLELRRELLASMTAGGGSDG